MDQLVSTSAKKDKPSHLRRKGNTRGKSRRFLSGSKVFKKHGGCSFPSDKTESVVQALGGRVGSGLKPNHSQRAIDIKNVFPDYTYMGLPSPPPGASKR